jgi:phosphoglycolate phosphatase-like HAD superfamily hydrolase
MYLLGEPWTDRTIGSNTSAMRPTVLLFDIDGTLITTGGAGRRAMERAFEQITGKKGALAEIPLDGMTDRLIGRSGLAALGHETSEAAIDAVLATYLEVLAEEVASVSPERYRVHRGMHEAIRSATERGAAVGLGTGNLRAGAAIKLERVDLNGCFAFGGFGCDAEARTDLIRIGAERGAAALGALVTACRIVVIGDTPRDVAAAIAIGADAIGVGTGRYSPAELRGSGARFAFRDLSEPGALEALLGEREGSRPMSSDT